MGDERSGDDWAEWRAKHKERVRRRIEGVAGDSLMSRRSGLVSSDGYELKRNKAGEMFFVHGTRAGRNRTIHIDGRGEDYLREHGVEEGDRLSSAGFERLMMLGVLTDQDGQLSTWWTPRERPYQLPQDEEPSTASDLLQETSGNVHTDETVKSSGMNQQALALKADMQRQTAEAMALFEALQQKTLEAFLQTHTFQLSLQITGSSACLDMSQTGPGDTWQLHVNPPTASDPTFTVYDQRDVDDDDMIQEFDESNSFADAVRELFALAAETIVEALGLPEES